MEALISKKELLEITKISYGQLYRWKRMDMIPEEWFIKKATPTGQETFFEREKILERIQFILSKKDDVSLEEIASMINQSDHESFQLDDAVEEEAISQYTKDVFYTIYDESQVIGKKELLIMAIIEHYLVKSIITVEELKLMVPIIEERFEQMLEKNSKLFLYRKFGVSFILGCKNQEEVMVDKAAVKIAQIDIYQEVEKMKKRLDQ